MGQLRHEQGQRGDEQQRNGVIAADEQLGQELQDDHEHHDVPGFQLHGQQERRHAHAAQRADHAVHAALEPGTQVRSRDRRGRRDHGPVAVGHSAQHTQRPGNGGGQEKPTGVRPQLPGGESVMGGNGGDGSSDAFTHPLTGQPERHGEPGGQCRDQAGRPQGCRLGQGTDRAHGEDEEKRSRRLQVEIGRHEGTHTGGHRGDPQRHQLRGTHVGQQRTQQDAHQQNERRLRLVLEPIPDGFVARVDGGERAEGRVDRQVRPIQSQQN